MMDLSEDEHRVNRGNSGEGLADLLDLGLTYRQVSYWSKRGYLRPHRIRLPADGRGVSSGTPYVYPDSEIRVAQRMQQLIRDGYRLDVAARKARS